MRPLSIRLCCMLLCLFSFSAQAAVNTFWSQPQRGGNSFNEQRTSGVRPAAAIS